MDLIDYTLLDSQEFNQAVNSGDKLKIYDLIESHCYEIEKQLAMKALLDRSNVFKVDEDNFYSKCLLWLKNCVLNIWDPAKIYNHYNPMTCTYDMHLIIDVDSPPELDDVYDCSQSTMVSIKNYSIANKIFQYHLVKENSIFFKIIGTYGHMHDQVLLYSGYWNGFLDKLCEIFPSKIDKRILNHLKIKER